MSDVVVVPLSLLVAGLYVAFVCSSPRDALGAEIFFGLIISWLLVGRLAYKAYRKWRTQYVLSNRRALVFRGGRLVEEQHLAGAKPEVVGWRSNRIVTFGDGLRSMVNGTFNRWGWQRPISGNSGLYPAILELARGDASGYPIRFYDLDVAAAEEVARLSARSAS